jgi:hypothetical protein
MKMFDLLIANIDRNQGNLIYDADWHLKWRLLRLALR